MGAADTVTKAYMRKNSIFADAFNYLLYDGKRIIDPDSLNELDTTEIALPFGDNSTDETVQKYRDILKSAVVKQDEKIAYVLLGIENQTAVCSHRHEDECLRSWQFVPGGRLVDG